MAAFAQVDRNNWVTQVVVIDNSDEPKATSYIRKELKLFGEWIQTSYNTRGNIHYGSDGKPDDKPPLRGNFAKVGYKYDRENDVFYAPQPFPSWIISAETNWEWEPPVPAPQDGQPYIWDESNKTWA